MLPQKEDCNQLLVLFRVLVVVMICRWIPAYKPFAKWASPHIKHEHTNTMRNASVFVSFALVVLIIKTLQAVINIHVSTLKL